MKTWTVEINVCKSYEITLQAETEEQARALAVETYDEHDCVRTTIDSAAFEQEGV